MKRLLLGLLFSLWTTLVLAQGCGPTNPNCIVPTAPAGTNNNQAASTAFVQLEAPFLHARDYGAVGDSVHDDTTNLQTWINACQTSGVVCFLDSASTCYKTTAALSVTSAINITGADRDTSYICPSGATQDGIDVNTNAAVQFYSFRINPSVVTTGGTCVSVTGPTQSQRVVIRDLFLQSCFTAITMNVANLWTIQGVYISGAVNLGISVVTGGDSTIADSIISVGASAAGITFAPTGVIGGLRISNDKIIGANSTQTAIQLIPAAGSTASDLQVTGSSIEQFTNGFFASKGTSTSFTNLLIEANEFETTNCIATDSSASWLKEIAFIGNVCQIESSGTGIILNTGVGVDIVGNQFYASGTGIVVGANVTNANIVDNQFDSGVTTPLMNTNSAVLARLELNGHESFVGATPANPVLSTCGTTGSATTAAGSTDNVGTLTTGSTAGTSCILVFAHTYSAAPRCFCQNAGGGNACAAAVTTTTNLTLSYASSASQTFNWECFGN